MKELFVLHGYLVGVPPHLGLNVVVIQTIIDELNLWFELKVELLVQNQLHCVVSIIFTNDQKVLFEEKVV